jgi:hypothetical protein
MWLALSSIVLGTAIGSNVLALWLTGSFECRRPAKPAYTERNVAL